MWVEGNSNHSMRIDVWRDTRARAHPAPRSIKHVYAPDRPLQRRFSKTSVNVVEEDTIVAALRLKEKGFRPMVLNLADDIFGGGCVDVGSGAQEESLFRRSNYFTTLHNDRRRDSFYPIEKDEAVYSGGVTVFKDSEKEQYRLLDRPATLDFIACPGLKYPDLVYDDPNGDGRLSEEEKATLEMKIRLILQVGQLYGHDSLVLGALGCGAWRNPPRDVAAVFKKVLDESNGAFERIDFAIISVTSTDKSNLDIFRQMLQTGA